MKLFKPIFKHWSYLADLVVIILGIVIALSLDNWNQNQKKNQQAYVYLKGLKGDLDFDINTLDIRISVNDTVISKVDTILSTLATKEELTKNEMIAFIEFHLPLARESYFIPEKSTIRQIEASSQGDLLRNEELRNLLFRYYSINDRNEKNQEVSIQLYQHNYISEHIMNTVLMSGDYFDFKLAGTINRPYLDFSQLSMNTLYLSAVLMKKENTESQNGKYKTTKAMAENLVQMIEIELTKF
jgi:hypothetical protein